MDVVGSEWVRYARTRDGTRLLSSSQMDFALDKGGANLSCIQSSVALRWLGLMRVSSHSRKRRVQRGRSALGEGASASAAIHY